VWTVGDRVTIKVERRADPNDADVVTGTLTSLLITGVDATSQSITVAIPTTVINAALITWGPSLQPFIKGTNILTYKTEQNVIIDHFKTGVTNISADVDNKLDLRNGELVIVPVSPLEPLTWYRLQYSMGTASYQTGAQTIHFKTNARGK
jgi:hypothetical protein